ncbi:hypothetical protein [Moorena producens]|nr:hypothetical protein [Moorena producens]
MAGLKTRLSLYIRNQSIEISITLMANSPRFPIPDSRLPIPDSLLPTP